MLIRQSILILFAFLIGVGAEAAPRLSCPKFLSTALNIASRNPADPLAITRADKTLLESSEAKVAALEIKNQLTKLPREERLNVSFGYFETQIRFGVELIRKLKREGFDPAKDFPTADQLGSEEFRSELIKFFETYEERAKDLIKNNRATMSETAQFLMDIEILRSVRVESLRVANGTWEATSLTGFEPFEHFQDFTGSRNEFDNLVRSGFIVFPSFSDLDVSFFSETWPRVRPIGFSFDSLVDFDGGTDRPSYELPLHDLNDHQTFVSATEAVFDALENLESRFLAKAVAVDPRLLGFAKSRYFDSSHDDPDWMGELKIFADGSKEVSEQELAKQFTRNGREFFSHVEGKAKSLWLKDRPEGFASLQIYLGRDPMNADLGKLDMILERLILEALREVHSGRSKNR